LQKIDLNAVNDHQNKTDANDDDSFDSDNAVTLSIIYIIYILLGALIISTYESDIDYLTAIYFIFITLTSIGLGDVVPQRLGKFLYAHNFLHKNNLFSIY
jgi:hypothetical protein